MCGIAVATERERVDGMLEVLAHRGRDERRVTSWEGITVGFNRLAIVATAEGSQPVETETGILAFNGEIYNWREIRERLVRPPARESEAAVLAQLIYEWPLGFWRHLDGSYALVYVDKLRRRVVASRDFLGIVPLYRERKGLGIASERKALTDPVPVAAGETVWLDDRGRVTDSKRQDYYSMHLEQVDEAHVEFLFRRAVERRIAHSERPVCVALSGGLDSAMVLLAALRVNPLIEAVTVVSDPTSLEAQNALMLCEDFGVQHRLVVADEEDVDTERMRWVLEDPRPNPIKWRGFVRNYLVAKHAPGVVILCGEGADELGCGYPSHAREHGLMLEWKRLSTVRSMPAINLDRVNLGGMAWTREYRTPFLDRALVLYVMGCAAEPRKALWRRLAERMGVPRYVLDKPKYTSEEEALARFGGN
jgi:asparagine synthetase B (glutamine-hydrolysing)